jgi:1-acyl-sn-glycerol-3-phosphate acyltransferase
VKKFAGLLYAGWCGLAFLTLAVSALAVCLWVPTLRGRRRVAAAFARAFLRAAGIPFAVCGTERLPPQPCVIVANHASYIDGVVATAALPPEFAFVIKHEMRRVPLAGLMLRRLGSEFVDRSDLKRSASDARRVLKTAAAGQSLVFFPEGTFNETRQIGRFLRGAFATAERSDMPVVAVAIHGTRDVLPSGSLMMRRRAIRVEVLGTLTGPEARRASRELIGKAVGEPLA